MIKLYNITLKTGSACISLCLAISLIFSSLSAYSSESFFNATDTDLSFTTLNKNCIHHTNTTKTTFLAEVFDAEEEDDDFLCKKKTTLLSVFLRTLWTEKTVEGANFSALKHAQIPVVKLTEPCYIEYCSLKIPS